MQKLRDRWLQAGASSDLATELAALEARLDQLLQRLNDERDHKEMALAMLPLSVPQETSDDMIRVTVEHLHECLKVRAAKIRVQAKCTCGSQPDSTTSMGDLDEI